MEAAALLEDGLGELLEHSVHISALSWPQALQEANVAAMACDEQRQVGILLHHLHWDGCGGKARGDGERSRSTGENPGSKAAENSP